MMLTNEPWEDEENWISDYDFDYLKTTIILAEWLSPGYEWNEVDPKALELVPGTNHLERIRILREGSPVTLNGKRAKGPIRTLERGGNTITVTGESWKAVAQLEEDAYYAKHSQWYNATPARAYNWDLEFQGLNLGQGHLPVGKMGLFQRATMAVGALKVAVAMAITKTYDESIGKWMEDRGYRQVWEKKRFRWKKVGSTKADDDLIAIIRFLSDPRRY